MRGHPAVSHASPAKADAAKQKRGKAWHGGSKRLPLEGGKKMLFLKTNSSRGNAKDKKKIQINKRAGGREGGRGNRQRQTKELSSK